ncbi:MAG: glycosyltransferase family 2 protein, partial [Pseudomonadota bacterium]
MQSPVLFLIFNRPDTTERVFDAIRAARPKRLYVAADGARSDRKGEAAKVDQAREIASQVDWDCDLTTWFRDENLGCRYGPTSGIDWFFEHETEGIILEDDCLPDPSFFAYCDELLAHYRDEPRVMAVCGSSYLPAGAAVT